VVVRHARLPARPCAGQTVRAQPFDAIEIRVGELFGDDEDA
jgi:hypothetical protein